MKTTFVTTFLVAIVCHVSGWCAELNDVQRRYIDLPDNIVDTAVVFPLDSSAAQLTLEARASLGTRSKNTAWGVGWTSAQGQNYTVMVTRAPGDKNGYDDIATDPSLRIVLSLNDTCLLDKVVAKGMATASGYNTLSVDVKDDISIYAGCGLLEHIGSYPIASTGVTNGEFICKGDVSADYAVIEEGFPSWRKVMTEWTRDSIDRYIASSSDIHEGMWRYLDREMDPAVSRLGGKYQIALVSNSEGGYDILYYSGAETAANQWRCGMLKGTLTPSPFAGQYDLKWYDAQFGCHTDEAYATFSEGNRLLTLSLPLLRATLRFARL